MTIWLCDVGMRKTNSGTKVFTAIADPIRRAMLLRLAREGERNATQLMEPFDVNRNRSRFGARLLKN